MRETVRRIGVLTGGGDAPGLNAAISAVVEVGINEFGWEVVGVKNGFEGLLGEPRTQGLGLDDVRDIRGRGGTVLGGADQGKFTPSLREPDRSRHQHLYRQVADNVHALGIDALVAIGGDSTLWIAGGVVDHGIRVIGVPKTIDNDVYGTDRTIGFATAVTMATETLGDLRTHAASHDRVMVLEVMGRDTGWIALYAGVDANADVVLIPEIPFCTDAVAKRILDREAAGVGSSLVVVAEGAAENGGKQIYRPGTGTYGGIGDHVADALADRTGKAARSDPLGHRVRGADPTPHDQELAMRLSAEAVRALATGLSGEVVVLQGDDLRFVPISECGGQIKRVPLDEPRLLAAREQGIVFGDEALGAS